MLRQWLGWWRHHAPLCTFSPFSPLHSLPRDRYLPKATTHLPGLLQQDMLLLVQHIGLTLHTIKDHLLKARLVPRKERRLAQIRHGLAYLVQQMIHLLEAPAQIAPLPLLEALQLYQTQENRAQLHATLWRWLIGC